MKAFKFIYYKTVILILLIPYQLLYSQKTLSTEEIMEDYRIFKNVLETAHPALYEYTGKNIWDSLFHKFEEEKGMLKTDRDLFRSLSFLTEKAKDGHLIVFHPKMEKVPPLFPLLLKIIDGKFYTDTDDFDIPVASEIISINNINSSEILKRLLKYAVSDAYNLTRKYRKIEIEFGFLYFNEFGKKDYFDIKFIAPDKSHGTKKIKSQSFEKIKMRNVNRNSYFSIYHKNKNKLEHFKKTANQKWPYLYFIDSIKTAVLTVNSFGLDIRKFKSKLIDLFEEIDDQDTENLVIDIRQNNGGFRPNAQHLFSFLSENEFKLSRRETMIISELPEKEHIKHTLTDLDKFFEGYFAKSKKIGSHHILEAKDMPKNEIEAQDDLYEGKTYVLIGGRTFSAGTAFAINAKHTGEISLIGEESGGAYHLHTGQYPVYYELPNSKIILVIFLVKIDHHIQDNTAPKGRGVIPDVEIEQSVNDLIHGTDSQLDYVIRQI